VTILFSRDAEDDFRIVVEFLAERNPAAASALADRIFSVIDQLAAGDFDGPERELTTGERVRSFAVPPVRIYYQRADGALWIIRIYDQRQRSIER
jgi:plasmid stabilization system protein ParE